MKRVLQKCHVFFLDNKIYQFQTSTLVMHKGTNILQKTNKSIPRNPCFLLHFYYITREARKTQLLESLILSELFTCKMFCQNMNIIAIWLCFKFFSHNFYYSIFYFIYFSLHCFKNYRSTTYSY